VDNPFRVTSSKPIGVLAAIAAGFDRVAAKPILILPSLLVDLLLWFGPHLTITAMIPEGVSWLAVSADADPVLAEQLIVVQQMIDLIRERYNVLGALSILPAGMPFNLLVASGSLPAGLPSLMAGRLPIITPLGAPVVLALENPLAVCALWIGLTVGGLGLGALYHRWLAHQADPQAQLGSGWLSWGRMVILYAAAYLGGILVLLLTIMAASVVGLLVPLLGAGVLLIGFSLLFWTAIYLAFTSHGIIRYQFGLLKAMVESAYVVRANLLSSVGFLFLAFGLTWFLTAQVWALPDESSWYTLLALFGHAFMSATLITASYSFYQGRRAWLQNLRVSLLSKISEDHGPSGPEV
jgi:hypothetical protein